MPCSCGEDSGIEGFIYERVDKGPHAMFVVERILG